MSKQLGQEIPHDEEGGATFDPGKFWNDTVHAAQEQWNQFADGATHAAQEQWTQFANGATHAVQGVVDGWNQWTASPEGQQAQDIVSNVIHTAQGPFDDSISDPNGGFATSVHGISDSVVEPADPGASSAPDWLPDTMPRRFDPESIADPVMPSSAPDWLPDKLPVRFDPESISDPVPSSAASHGIPAWVEEPPDNDAATGGNPSAVPDWLPDKMPHRFDDESISDSWTPSSSSASSPEPPPVLLEPPYERTPDPSDPFAAHDEPVQYPDAQLAPYANYERTGESSEPSDPFAAQDESVLFTGAALAPYANYERTGGLSEPSDPFAAQDESVLFPGAALAPYATYDTAPTMIDAFAGDATDVPSDVVYQDATTGEYFQVDPTTGDVTTVDPATITDSTSIESSTELDPNSVNPDYVDSSGQVSAEPTPDAGGDPGFTDPGTFDTSSFDTSSFDSGGGDASYSAPDTYDPGTVDAGGGDTSYSAPEEAPAPAPEPPPEPAPEPPPEPAPPSE